MKILGSILAPTRHSKFWKSTNRSRGYTCRRPLCEVEQLEQRQLLAAHPLDVFEGTITSAGDTSDLNLTVSLPDGDSAATAVVGLMVTAPAGSALSPAAPRLARADGDPIAPLPLPSASSTPAGLSLFQLGAGEYTVQIAGDGTSQTSGDFQMSVYLAGDALDPDGQVDLRERQQATAAVVRTLGSPDYVSRLFFRQVGVDLSRDLYDEGLDANWDGTIDSFDLAQLHINQLAGLVVVNLEADSGAPVIEVQLSNDTGSDESDAITTDATVSGTLQDDEAIASFRVSIDGAADVELLEIVGDLGTSGEFELTPADLETAHGQPLAEGPHTLKFSATDELGNATTTPTELAFTLIVDNQPPAIAAIAAQSVNEDTSFELDLAEQVTDPDTGDEVVLAVSTSTGAALPAWLEFDEDTGQLSGAPDNDDVGTVTVQLRATDSQDASTTATFTVTVVNVNDAPTMGDIPNQTADENSPFRLDISTFVKDVDAGDTVTLTATLGGGGALPDWLSFDPATGVFSGTPTSENLGVFSVLVSGTDESLATASDSFTITVADVNDDPVLEDEIDDQQAQQGQPFSLDISPFFSDPDADDTLTFAATLADDSPLPAWLSLNAATGVLSGTPANGDVGTLQLEVTASDSLGASVSDSFTLAVANVNDPPALTEPIPDQSVDEDAQFTIELAEFFQDVDAGDTVTFVAALAGGDPLPAWIQLDGATGVLSGLATNDQVGTISIQVTVTDQAQASVSDTFALTVTNVNDPPTAGSAIADQEVDQDEAFLLDASSTFADVDPGDQLTFSATVAGGQPLPGWLSINPATGVLSGTPTNDDVGSLTVQVTATDLASATATSSFVLTIHDVNDAPVASDQTFTLSPDSPAGTIVGTVAATDPDDADELSYAVVDGDPEGIFSVDAATGEIRLEKPDLLVEDVPVTLTVRVTDSGTPALSDTAAITIQVVTNNAPVASDIPEQLVSELQVTTLNIGQFFSDPDGDTLTFAAKMADGSSLPAWLSLDGASGIFQVSAPTNDDVGTVTVEVTATDTASHAVSASFDLTVVNINDPPQIVEPIPDQVASEGSAFQLDLRDFFDDPDADDTLTFTVTPADGSALPAWLTLSAGQLTGTPGAGDVGVLSLRVTATDQASAVAEQTFDLTVSGVNDPPTAADDSGLSTNNATVLSIPATQLLANDSDPDVGDTLIITSVSATSAQAATVTLAEGQITYDPVDASQLAGLGPGEELTDTFQYTVSDGQGATATATVSVTVRGQASMVFRLETTNLTGTPISTIQSGESFLLRAFVQDMRTDPSGVFSAYLDVTYDASRVTASGDIDYGDSFAFPDTAPGKLDQPGLIDEVGAIAGFSETGAGEFLVFSLQFTAGSTAGSVTFTGDPADDEVLHAVIFFEPVENVPTSHVDYGQVTLEITSTTFAALHGADFAPQPLLVWPSIGEAELTTEADAVDAGSSSAGDATAAGRRRACRARAVTRFRFRQLGARHG